MPTIRRFSVPSDPAGTQSIPIAARQVVTGLDILYDGPVSLFPARVVAALRAFAAAVKQISEGYAQGPPGC